MYIVVISSLVSLLRFIISDALAKAKRPLLNLFRIMKKASHIRYVKAIRNAAYLNRAKAYRPLMYPRTYKRYTYQNRELEETEAPQILTA